MKLLTKEIRDKLPKLYSQEDNPDPTVVVKFFDPQGSWTWYATEGSPIDENGVVCDQTPARAELLERDFLFFGLVDGFEVELGYFSLNELKSVVGPLGLGIERDKYWKPVPLSEVQKDIDERRAG